MRRIGKIVLAFLIVVILLLAGFASWVLFYSHDLPDTAHLGDFAPAVKHQAMGDCVPDTVTAIPFSEIGKTLAGAVAAAEGGVEGDSLLRAELKRNSSVPHRATLSQQIARTLFCNSSERPLHRQVKELRLAIRLDRQFSRQQLFAIYLNRVSFGECGVGVQNASQYLFHKDPVGLTSAEAPLLAGMISRPGYYSPGRHPDRALVRRNEVLDAMVASRQLTPADATQAKNAPLLP